MPKAQPDHYYGFGKNSNICVRCGVIRRAVLGWDKRPRDQGEWSHDDGKTWTMRHSACPGYGSKKMADNKRYPLCNQLSARDAERRQLTTFLEWLEERDIDIIEVFQNATARFDVNSIEKLVLRYFEIDPEKLEAERRAMLEAVRAAQ